MQNLQQVQDVYGFIKAAVFGHAVGDALGVPVEFFRREKLEANPITDMVGFGTHQVPAGTWSDDTSMTLCTLASLTEHRRIIPEDIMQHFFKWVNEGECTPFGRAFGIGRTTIKALSAYHRGEPYGLSSERDCGNGSLMRILPVLLYQHFCEQKSVEERIREVHTVSALTHAHERPMMACGIYAFIAEELLQEPSRCAVARGLKNAENFYHDHSEYPLFQRLFSPAFAETPSEEIQTSGYVIDTLEAAVWCLLTTESYRECVLRAVNLGRDADTVAAVSGGLAGLLYGFAQIPAEWVSTLVQHEQLDGMCLAAAESWCQQGK